MPPLSLRRAPRPAARRRASARPASAKADFDERPPPAATIIGVGTGLMINAAGFGAAYRTVPELKLLAGILEETQAARKTAHRGAAAFAQRGAPLAAAAVSVMPCA